MTDPLAAAVDLERHLGDPHDGAAVITFDHAVRLDEVEAFPAAAIAALEAWGFARHLVPAALGGELRTAESTFALIRAVSRRDLTVAIAKAKTLLGALPMWIGGDAGPARALADRVLAGQDVSLALTERAHGSDLVASEVIAEARDGGYVVSGEKWLINNATRGQVLIVLAATGTRGPRGLSLFLIDKASLPAGTFEALPKVRTLGIRGADISGFRLTKAPVPATAVVGRGGRGLELVLKTFQVSRTLCAALSLGALDAGFDVTLRFVRGRNLYGRPLWDIRVVRDAILRALLDLWIADALSFVSCRALHHRPEQMSVVSAIVKFAVPTIVDGALRDLATVLGARHYLREETSGGIFQKILRDHALVPLFDGSTQANLHAIATQLRALGETYLGRTTGDASIVATLGRDAPAELAFDRLRITSRGEDDVLAALRELGDGAEDEDGIVASARALAAVVEETLREAVSLPHGDPLDEPRAFALATKLCQIEAGAACLLVARTFPRAPRGWWVLATQRVLGWLGKAHDPQLDLWAGVEAEVHRRASGAETWGLVPMSCVG